MIKNKSGGFFTQANIQHYRHLVRPRLNGLLEEATKSPLVIVTGGAGFGKTCAVYDFSKKSEMPTLWMQLSEHDNVASRFWENYISTLTQVLKQPVDELSVPGFPDTGDKMNRYFDMHDRDFVGELRKKYLMVLDDFHFIHNLEVAGFLGQLVQRATGLCSLIVISREFPRISIEARPGGDEIPVIREEDLNFTENEMFLYLNKQGLPVTPQLLHEVMSDTNGWAFASNFVAQSLSKSPGYAGYTRNAVKKSLFEQMEIEAWNAVSDPLKHFLVRLSLIEHLSADLIGLLAEGDDRLLAEFRKQNAYIHYNESIDAYQIHHLYLDFLRSRQGLLSGEEKQKTYRIAALWCKQNAFTTDALDYCEKIGDYESILYILLTSFMTHDLAVYAEGIFARASDECFDRIELFAAAQLYIAHCLGHWEECLALGARYEKRFKKLPESNNWRNHALGGLYFCMGLSRLLLCTMDDHYDFDGYFAKMDKYFTKSPVNLGNVLSSYYEHGAWMNYVGSSRKGAPQEFIDADVRTVRSISHCQDDIVKNYDDVCLGELKFYQGEMEEAKSCLALGLERMEGRRQYDITHRALFYRMRIAVMQGDQAMFEQAFLDISDLKEEKNYANRFVTNDIAVGWYYYILRRPELIPGWLKAGFSAYGHSHFIENFGNQIKARYHFLVKRFQPLLLYIEEMKHRESSLYGRVEMLAIEACVHYQMKDKAAAFAALGEAYKAAAPNDITMPFIELGKDMRTLTTAVLREQRGRGIPREWLETINKKAQLYAKYQAMLISKWEKAAGADKTISLSPRETMVLHDLYAGFSRADIAEKQKLSINTVNMNVRSICMKLQAKNTVDIIRIAVEEKLV